MGGGGWVRVGGYLRLYSLPENLKSKKIKSRVPGQFLKYKG